MSFEHMAGIVSTMPNQAKIDKMVIILPQHNEYQVHYFHLAFDPYMKKINKFRTKSRPHQQFSIYIIMYLCDAHSTIRQ